MAHDSVLQVRMDSALKKDVEQLYRKMGTSFSEAVRVFAQQSLLQQRLPFDVASDIEISEKQLETRVYSLGQVESGFGMFAHLADPSKRALEKTAWKEAVAKKHDSKNRGK